MDREQTIDRLLLTDTFLGGWFMASIWPWSPYVLLGFFTGFWLPYLFAGRKES